MIKKVKLIFLCLILLFINVTKAKADDFTSDYGISFDVGEGGDSSQSGSSGSGSSQGGSGGNNASNNWSKYNNPINGKKYEYQATIKVGNGASYNISTYNFNGVGNSIKSGTWVGINAIENQWATWEAKNIIFREVKKKHICNYTKTVQVQGECQSYVIKYVRGKKTLVCTKRSSTNQEISEKKEFVRDYYESFSCPSPYSFGYTNVSYSSEDSPENSTMANFPGDYVIRNLVYNQAYAKALSLLRQPLAKLQITTEELDSNNNYKMITIDGATVEKVDPGSGPSGRVSVKYGYSPSNICINLKTGKVSYNKDCTKDAELKVNSFNYNGITYWQYFSPLNMKSGSNFNLAVLKNQSKKLSGSECQSIMNNSKTKYQNYITTLNGSSLKGDYCKNGNCNNLNKGRDSDWESVSNGCYFTTRISFPVVQKYYYEEKKNNELIFNGYNFYYRPININNPFPNVPTKNSLWYEWYNSNNKKPNLKDSFKEITYSVDVSNKLAETIRAYNLNNQYPDFDKLSLKGKSSFLQSIGVEALTKDKTYSLGGGTKTCVKNGTVSIGSDCS